MSESERNSAGRASTRDIHTGRVSRPLVVAVVVFTLTAVSAAALIWRLELQLLQVERARVADLAGNHARALQISIERALTAVYSLAAMVRLGNGTVTNFDALVGEMLPYYPGVSALELAPGGIIRNVMPLVGNEKAVGFDLLKDPVQKKEAAIARDTGKLTLAGPIKLVQGGQGIVGRLPVFLDDDQGQPSFWGFTLVVIRFPGALAPARLSQLVERGFAYELWRLHPDSGQKQVIDAAPPLPLAEPVEYSLALPNGAWTLSVSPARGWGDPPGLALKVALGLLFSLILAYLAKLMVDLKVHQQGLELQVARRTAEIQVSEQKFSAVFNMSPVITALTAYPEGVLLDVNQSFTATFGFSPAEAAGKTTVELKLWVNPADRERYLELIRDAAFVHGFETVMRVKNGTRINVMVSGGIVNINDRACLLNVVIDITGQKRMEQALRTSERRFRELLENIHLLAVILDREGTVTFCNRFLLSQTGWSREEVLGENWFERFIPPGDGAAAESLFAAAMAGASLPAHHESPIRTRAGADRIIVWDTTLLRGAADEVVGAASIGIDVTEHRSVEAQLLQSQKLEAIGRLAGGIAHDFNNLLTPILGYSELLRSSRDAAGKDLEQVEFITEAALKARDLTRQLLSFGRKQPLDMQIIDLNEVVNAFAGILRRTIRENIEIRLEPAVASACVRADRIQIEQVIMNLVVNAQDAIADKGVITIATEPVVLDAKFVRSHPEARPGRSVMLTVSDSGQGIDTEVLPRIFEPFFSTKEVSRGAGLGLATVYGIVQQHEGNIWVASGPGQGTVFMIALPAVDGVPAGGGEKPKAPRPRQQASGTVLLVEDNETVLALVRSLLSECGYTVVATADPLLAPQLAAAQRFDLLVSDVVMPGMNGPELHRRLLDTTPGLKVLFMSGYTDNIVAQHVELKEGLNFIQKPFKIDVMARKVAEIIGGVTSG